MHLIVCRGGDQFSLKIGTLRRRMLWESDDWVPKINDKINWRLKWLILPFWRTRISGIYENSERESGIK